MPLATLAKCRFKGTAQARWRWPLRCFAWRFSKFVGNESCALVALVDWAQGIARKGHWFNVQWVSGLQFHSVVGHVTNHTSGIFRASIAMNMENFPLHEWKLDCAAAMQHSCFKHVSCYALCPFGWNSTTQVLVCRNVLDSDFCRESSRLLLQGTGGGHSLGLLMTFLESLQFCDNFQPMFGPTTKAKTMIRLVPLVGLSRWWAPRLWSVFPSKCTKLEKSVFILLPCLRLTDGRWDTWCWEVWDEVSVGEVSVGERHRRWLPELRWMAFGKWSGDSVDDQWSTWWIKDAAVGSFNWDTGAAFCGETWDESSSCNSLIVATKWCGW